MVARVQNTISILPHSLRKLTIIYLNGQCHKTSIKIFNFKPAIYGRTLCRASCLPSQKFSYLKRLFCNNLDESTTSTSCPLGTVTKIKFCVCETATSSQGAFASCPAASSYNNFKGLSQKKFCEIFALFEDLSCESRVLTFYLKGPSRVKSVEVLVLINKNKGSFLRKCPKNEQKF
jgi:hypothetical protein